jgi:hypothetical protein
MNLHQSRLTCYVSALFFAFILAVATGCGSVSSNSNPTPTPTPVPGTTPSPTPVATPTPSPSPTPTPSPSNAAITGRVVDPSGIPVVGTVKVALLIGIGDFSTFKIANADTNGNFRFDNVPAPSGSSDGYAIMVAARAAHDPGTAPGSPGSYYTPALLMPGNGPFGAGSPILPGTNVGTIQLRFTSQGDIEGLVTSTNSSQTAAVPVHAVISSAGIFTRDFIFDFPLIPPPPSFNTQAGASCPAGTACANYTIDVVPTNPVEEAVFNTSGYTFAPSQTAANFTLRIDAFSLANNKPTCTTPELAVGANDLKSDSPNTAGTAQFQGCQ